jgi:hypothetical protein
MIVETANVNTEDGIEKCQRLAMRETTWAGGGLDLVDHIVTRVEGSVKGRQEEDSQSDFDYNSDDDDDYPNPNPKPPRKDRQWFKIRGWFKF